ncbi:DUF6479 family protein [Streptomyces sp. FIT100]|uniref:DUF6479 family protein n=1 Tax=Streptomyces sp. FIT100 TaxID=2837956 RepID=UPI0021C7C6CB|nr:DUF6479 family protein [Streptomyces sp. FIT100]UUN27612.1 hypothetical protein KK483_15290 [Streptomyces sp. FIT100]
MNSLMIVQSSSVTDQAAASQLAGIGPFIIGIILIALLAGAMWYEGRRRLQERAPRPEEQPKAPDHPTHIEEVREPDEDAFPTGGERLLPYNLKTYSSHAAPEAEVSPAAAEADAESEAGPGETGAGRAAGPGGGDAGEGPAPRTA